MTNLVSILFGIVWFFVRIDILDTTLIFQQSHLVTHEHISIDVTLKELTLHNIISLLPIVYMYVRIHTFLNLSSNEWSLRYVS